jgi:excisionase family DNA binding protein
MTTTALRRFYRASEVAERLRVSLATVYRRIEDRTLPSTRIGGVLRVPVAAVDVDARKVP